MRKKKKVFWLTRDDTYIGREYQLFHYEDHPEIYKGSFCSTAKKGVGIRWERFSAENWENHTGIKLRPGTRTKIEIREV